ncbi:MBL fold metallo-hydrolase [Mycobacterium sp. M26]|uniref:MBL fold metallo-hydrolase n=1 Tax=Mycobacterium sp. M26 TaxID=1762962 RepID=UPI0009EAF6EC|nr:MBL fold metallo-hydrolase [Mycobacterium sp. M26]
MSDKRKSSAIVSTLGSMTALGTGGWIPTNTRLTSCYLFKSGNRALVLDAGSGFGRLTLEPELLNDVTDLTILLSHFHLDHIEGLSMTNGFDIPVTIGGPGLSLYGMSTKNLLFEILGKPFKTSNPLIDASFVDIIEGDSEVNGWNLASRGQFRHTLPSMAFRIADEFAYVTDTEYDESSISFAADVKWLLHEAWGACDAEIGHASGVQAGQVAASAGVGGLYLTHLNPAVDSNAVLAAAKSRFPLTFLATDHQILFGDPADGDRAGQHSI